MVLWLLALTETAEDENKYTLHIVFNLEKLCWISPTLLQVWLRMHKKCIVFYRFKLCWLFLSHSCTGTFEKVISMHKDKMDILIYWWQMNKATDRKNTRLWGSWKHECFGALAHLYQIKWINVAHSFLG